MDKELFHDGRDVGGDDGGPLQAMEDLRVEEHTTSLKEIAGSYGIMLGLTLSNPSAWTGQVAAGAARDPLGRILRFITGDSYTNRAAPKDFVFSAGDVDKLVCLAYNEANTTNVDDPVTGTPQPTRQKYYPTIHLRVAAESNDVVLGSITAIDGSGNATFSTELATYWGARLTPAQLEIILAASFGIVSHQYTDHVSGIETIGGGGDPGAITINGVTTPDSLEVTDTVSKDSVLINGVRLQGANKFTDRSMIFSGPEVTLEPQVWAIHVNSDGACGKTLAAQYDAAQVVVGLQIVDLCPFGIPYPTASLVIDQWKSGPTHFLRIAGNSTISPTVSGLYHLRTDADPDIAVLVYVTIASLPTGGSSGAPNQDVITIYDIYDKPAGFPEEFSAENPPVTVLDADLNEGNLLLGFLWWYGTGLNLLGYGPWATTGVAYDKRSQGNLHPQQVSDAFKTKLDRMISETRGYGFVATPSITTAGLNATLTADTDQPYAYIDGKRVRIPHLQIVAITNNNDSVIYLLDNGDGTASWGAQLGSGSTGVALDTGKMSAWNVTAAAGDIEVTLDLTVTLSRLDREAVRLGRVNDGEADVSRLVGNSLRLGRRSLDDADAAVTDRVILELPEAAVAARVRNIAAYLGNTTGSLLWTPPVGLGWTIYTENTLDLVMGFELVLNAYWDKDTSLWTRRTSAVDAAILSLSPEGRLRFYRREAASADTWTTAYSALGWETMIADVSEEQTQTRGDSWLTLRVADALSGDIDLLDNSDNINTAPTVLTAGTDGVKVEFIEEMANANYSVQVTFGPVDVWGGTGFPVPEVVLKATTHFHIVIRDSADGSGVSLTAPFTTDLTMNITVRGKM